MSRLAGASFLILARGGATNFLIEDRAWDKDAPQELCMHGVTNEECLSACFNDASVLTSLSKVLNCCAHM